LHNKPNLVYDCCSFAKELDIAETIKLYIVLVKSLETLLFLMCLKEVSDAHQGGIYLIKNTGKILL